ncbi:MAG: SPFH domain-containing protein [Chloroflexi bacterium]|nr:SPFH domain-containing protein [Chloroflexota bacterium]
MGLRIIDVIEWPDQGPTDIVQRVPEQGQGDIRLGSQLIVRPSQVAMFVRNGSALDKFTEGRHTLTTYNIPLITTLLKLATNDKTPFPAEVYFVTTKDFIDMKWGTPTELTVRDSELGMVQIRAFGTYSMAIQDPGQFVNQVVGVRGLFSTTDINDYLRSILLSEIASTFGSAMKGKSLLDLAAIQGELGNAVCAAAKDDFAAIGVALKKVYVVQVTPSEEIAKAIGQRQAGQAMRDAAKNDASGAAGLGAGLGAGMGIGQAMAGAMAAGMQRPAPAASAAPAAPVESAPTKASINAALTKLDLRFANGEVTEAVYNRLRENLEKALASAAA